jgi:hypothetical protein
VQEIGHTQVLDDPLLVAGIVSNVLLSLGLRSYTLSREMKVWEEELVWKRGFFCLEASFWG